MTHAADLARAASAIGGATTVTGSPSFAPGKNAIINGAFDIWQRGTSFAAIAHAAYHADRWTYTDNTDAVHTISRDSTTVPTVAQAGVLANYSLKVDVTTLDGAVAAGDLTAIHHRIEGYVWRNFAQRALTLSFWVKATKTGTYCVAIRNSGADRAFLAEYTVSVSDTWEKKTISITASPSAGTWDYTTGVGADLSWALECGSTFQSTAGWTTGNYLATASQVNANDSASNNFWLALVQLEVGDVATDFELRDFPTELAMCKRYWQQTYAHGVAAGTVTNTGAVASNAVGTAAGQANHSSMFVPPMRVGPAPTFYSPATGASGNWRRLTAGADVAWALSVTCSESAMWSAAQAAITDAEQVYGHWTASAEL